MTAAPITPVEAVPLLDRSAPLATTAAPNPSAQPLAAAATSFSQMLTNGIESINQKQIDADNMVRAFALDDSVPVHQVTYALQQAKLSLELGLQIRTRVLDAAGRLVLPGFNDAHVHFLMGGFQLANRQD